MHVNVLSDGELIFLIAFTGVFVWLIAAHWTKRQMRRSANVEGRAEAAVLEPLHQENRELRALVERQENRIRTLETIATDPSARTARAIDALP